MSPAQLARLTSPEVRAARDLLHKLREEQLVAEIDADDARCRFWGLPVDGGEVARCERAAFELQDAGDYVQQRISMHVSRGWHLVSTNAQARQHVEPHRRLKATVEAALAANAWHRATPGPETRTACGLTYGGPELAEGEESTGIYTPRDGIVVRYTTRPEGVTCAACKASGAAASVLVALAADASAALRMLRDARAIGIPVWMRAGLREHAYSTVAALWSTLRAQEAGRPASPGGDVGGPAWLAWRIVQGLRADAAVHLDDEAEALRDAIEWCEMDPARWRPDPLVRMFRAEETRGGPLPSTIGGAIEEMARRSPEGASS